jgi:hypothetical protein
LESLIKLLPHEISLKFTKLLLDENLPKKLKLDFPEHEIYTVSDKVWNSKKNGELLKLMLEEGYNVLHTFDKNLQFQQNFLKYPIAVIVLNAQDNAYITDVTQKGLGYYDFPSIARSLLSSFRDLVISRPGSNKKLVRLGQRHSFS